MADPPALFPGHIGVADAIVINDRCLLRVEGDRRVVVCTGLPVAHFRVDDRVAGALAAVQLVEEGWADQNDVARAFDLSPRTLRRYQRRFDDGGAIALARTAGYPKGRPRVRARDRDVERLKADGLSNRVIAHRLGVDEKSVRKRLRRLGFHAAPPEQMSLDLGPPPLPPCGPNLSASESAAVEPPSPPGSQGCGPNLSAFASAAADDAPLPWTTDRDPADRSGDRLLAYLGVLDDAAPLFRSGSAIPGAGVLLALPALLQSGALAAARRVYGSIGPAFYGLRTTIVALLLLALWRIKRPEALKEHSPATLGRMLGLDRAPEVKTLRRKLARLAAAGRAAQFGRLLAKRRVELRGDAVGFLYVDGHVRVYHGSRQIPKAHVARMRLALPATTDYWLNDQAGDPLLVITAEANDHLTRMLPPMLDEVRTLVGERRVTIVFDRGGWSPKLFARILADGFDVLTYRKGRSRRLPRRCFADHAATLDGREVRYRLADHGVRLRNGLRLRQVTRLQDDHQTQILTSRRDLPAIEVAYRMFERWRQENFFKYLREEFALDALVDYQTEPADQMREVPNPAHAAADAEIRRARDEFARLVARYGGEALAFVESRSADGSIAQLRRAKAAVAKPVWDALARLRALQRRRARIPARVPVRDVTDGEVVKLATERKLLSNLFKMVAYQAESDLARALAPHYLRSEDEGRTLIQSAFQSAADIEVTDSELRVTLAPFSSPHRTRAIAALCRDLDAGAATFPGTRLRVRYAVAEPAGAWA
jgi:DNA-binding CsgD family transcriptional regulator